MNFISTLILFSLCWPLVKCKSPCTERGWFGMDCKYRCHCKNNHCDKTNGQCLNNAKCVRGWFGLNCQYQDLATIANTTVTTDPTQTEEWLVDRNDDTCNIDPNLYSVAVSWSNPYRFTWLKIIFKPTTNSASMNAISLKFSTSRQGMHCLNKQSSFVDTNEMIIRCNQTEEVTGVKITGAGVTSMCSLYISGGRNLALMQRTNQTSTYENGESPKAVDGNINSKYNDGSCTHTAVNSDIIPIWTLHFDNPIIVTLSTEYLYITDGANSCCRDRLKFFNLKTFDERGSLVDNFTNGNSDQQVYNVNVQNSDFKKTITVLTISSANSSIVLSLCEVEAYGECAPGKWGLACNDLCPVECTDECNKETGLCTFCYGYSNPPSCTAGCTLGKYGRNCAETCPVNCDYSGCYAFTGKCKRCSPGYQGDICEMVCEPGKWGDNCKRNCEAKCVNSSCSHINGDCLQGCLGYSNPPKCTTGCNSNKYGTDCAEWCPSNCDSVECDSFTGKCKKCKAGYQGDFCFEMCKPGRWGVNCNRTCKAKCVNSSCSHINGDCLQGCLGYSNPPECTTECTSGLWGFNCHNSCDNCFNGHCNKSNGLCLQGCLGFRNSPTCNELCYQRNYGYNCQKTCSTKCFNARCNHVDGLCESCKPGYQGEMCEQGCNPGTYGLNCQYNCSTTCTNALCDHVKGVCESCEPGYQGEMCDQECNQSFYGKDCKNKCNTSCIDHLCGPINGNCYNCSIGRHGDQCDFCPTGSFGERCLSNCSSNCLGESCRPENGTCHGCKDGYEGDMCILAITSSPVNPGIVGSIVSLLVIAALLVAGVILWRRRDGVFKKIAEKSRRTETDDLGLSGLSSEGSGRDRPISDSIYNNLQPVLHDTSIAIKDFNSYMSSHKIEYFEDQFKSIPLPQNVSMAVGQSMGNKDKNRYKNICTYDHSRVCLMRNTDKNEGDYINASYIKGPDNEDKFIASQGPTKVMLNDFVRMIWEQKVETIVMLTNLIEEGKAKCEKYWPDVGEAQFGEITVKLTATKSFADYIIRSLEIFKSDKEVTRTCTQFHFSSWPDKGVPVTPWSLVEFLKRVSAQPTKSPMVVHCSAGVGRTGTFIALHNVIRQAQDTGRVDFYQTLAKMRQDRILMIQTAEQYMFLHKAAQAAIVCIDSNVTSQDISDRINKFAEKGITGETRLAEEFKGVCTACESFNNDTNDTIHELDDDGNVYVNNGNVNLTLKNRYTSMIPKQRFRPYLSCESKDMGEYINAVFVPGFTKKDQQLLTQLPMPTTVVDFWRLVSQYDVSLIVAFEIDAMAGDKSFGSYLPAVENENLSCPPFEIISIVKKQEPLWEERRLKIDTEKPKLSQPTSEAGSRSVIHIKSLFTDLSPKNLLSLVKQVRSYDAQARGRTLYTCRNGAHYSGLICVLSLLLDRIERDGSVCVPLVVGEIKSIRLEVIPTQEQYRVVYDVLVRYFQTSRRYENVGYKVCTKTIGCQPSEQSNRH